MCAHEEQTTRRTRHVPVLQDHYVMALDCTLTTSSLVSLDLVGITVCSGKHTKGTPSRLELGACLSCTRSCTPSQPSSSWPTASPSWAGVASSSRCRGAIHLGPKPSARWQACAAWESGHMSTTCTLSWWKQKALEVGVGHAHLLLLAVGSGKLRLVCSGSRNVLDCWKLDVERVATFLTRDAGSAVIPLATNNLGPLPIPTPSCTRGRDVKHTALSDLQEQRAIPVQRSRRHRSGGWLDRSPR
jgi:hypothetical protein